MASIRIHQDIYNFERKRNGFTGKQWFALVGAGVGAVAVNALCSYALRLPIFVGLVLMVTVILPFVVFGFVPIQRMPGERYFEKKSEMDERGNAVSWRGETPPERESELSREYLQACKQDGHENEVHGDLVRAHIRILAADAASA